MNDKTILYSTAILILLLVAYYFYDRWSHPIQIKSTDWKDNRMTVVFNHRKQRRQIVVSNGGAYLSKWFDCCGANGGYQFLASSNNGTVTLQVKEATAKHDPLEEIPTIAEKQVDFVHQSIVRTI